MNYIIYKPKMINLTEDVKIIWQHSNASKIITFYILLDDFKNYSIVLMLVLAEFST